MDGAQQVRCWGSGLNGQLGYGSTAAIGAPSSAPAVDLGPGRSAVSITAGGLSTNIGQTCAILDTGQVRCWGANTSGQLGAPGAGTIGDDETPGSLPVVDIGLGRTATKISAGEGHTCAILDTGDVRCWGAATYGELGQGNTTTVGDDETPGSVGVVDLGPGRTATAVAAGQDHTCAILDTAQVRCWGRGTSGALGGGNTDNIGDDEPPGSIPVVDLGAGRTATAIAAGGSHTCAILDTARVLCWGAALNGALGYGSNQNVGDNETPGSVGPVDLGGADATGITAGGAHTCAAVFDAPGNNVPPNAPGDNVVCWGFGNMGALGYGSTQTVGLGDVPGTRRVRFDPPLPPPPPVSPVAIPAPTVPASGGTAPPAPTPGVPPRPVPATQPTPQQGKNVSLKPVSGRIRVKVPGRGFRLLRRGERLRVGTVVDATAGRVRLSAADGKGGLQTAVFYSGRFRLTQAKGSPLVTLKLVESLDCSKPKATPRAARTISAARKSRKRKRRRLWGDGSGRFRTSGKHGTATVQGTKWLVEDRCTGTLVRVARGRVSVRDLRRERRFTLRAGRQVFLPADRRRKPVRRRAR